MQKYRKKPVVIEAIRFKQEMVTLIDRWMTEHLNGLMFAAAETQP